MCNKVMPARMAENLEWEPNRMTPTETNKSNEPRVATELDLRTIGATSTRAFVGDPVWEWLAPRARSWKRGMPFVFRMVAAEHLGHQTVWVTPDVTAVAVWAPPGHRTNQLRETLNAPRLAMVFGTKSLAGLRFYAAIRQAHPTEPHWYLALLATDPAHQGKGHGSVVLQPTLDRCDDNGLPAYLESSKESNVAYYRRHGFELQRELRPIASGPAVWLMWREPR